MNTAMPSAHMKSMIAAVCFIVASVTIDGTAAQTFLFSFGQTTPDNVNETTALRVTVPVVMTTTPSNEVLHTDTIVNISVTGGSATLGQDFNLSRTEVTFDTGANDGNSITLFVDILDDTLVEGTENFTLTGSVAPPASFNGSITVSILDNDVYAGCRFEVTSNNRGEYNWPATDAGNSTVLNCTFGGFNGVESTALRLCNASLQDWEDPNLDMCFTEVTGTIQRIGEMEITSENVQEVINSLARSVQQGSEDDQIMINLDVITRVSTRAVVVTPNIPLQQLISITRDVVQIINNIAQWPASVTNAAASRIIAAFEDIVNVILQYISIDEPLLVVEGDVALRAERVRQAVLEQNGRVFGVRASDDGPVMVGNETTITTQMSTLPEDQDASISLPPSLFAELRNTTEIGIGFTFYRTAALFPLPEGSPSNLTIGSSVIGALVGGQSISNLNEPVTIFLRLTQPNPINLRCVSWNFTAAGGSGNWTTDGCQLTEINGSVVTCRCSHLTNFAYLVDICTRLGGCEEQPAAVRFALDVISTVGTSLSLFGLSAAVITLLVSKSLRKRDVSKFQIQLCISLFCMLIVFVSGIARTSVYGGCVTVSVLIHYFTLVAWMWMGALAMHMYKKLVIVFIKTTTRYIIAVSIICWSVPIVPVIIPLAINRDFMITFSPPTINTTANATDTIRFCFIGNTGVLFGAYLGPIFAILLFNIVIFVVVISVLIKHARKQIGSSDKANQRTVIRVMLTIMGLMALFGLTWIFAAFTVSAASTAFQFLFAIFNSLQGFFIFLFFCVFGKEGRKLWLKVLCWKKKTPGIFAKQIDKQQKPSGPSTISSGLKSDSDTSTHNPASLSSCIVLQSSLISESEKLSIIPTPPQLEMSKKESQMEVTQSSTVCYKLSFIDDGENSDSEVIAAPNAESVIY